jgi:hypothetical protein
MPNVHKYNLHHYSTIIVQILQLISHITINTDIWYIFNEAVGLPVYVIFTDWIRLEAAYHYPILFVFTMVLMMLL